MTTDALQLLKQLGLSRPGLATTSPAPGAPGPAFADLLKQAASGQLESRTPISIEPEAGVQLAADQLAMLSKLADQAEAAGVRTALVMLDGQPLIMDVASRTITGKASPTAGVYSGIDGMIDMRGSGQVQKLDPAHGFSAGLTTHPGVLDALSKLSA